MGISITNGAKVTVNDVAEAAGNTNAGVSVGATTTLPEPSAGTPPLSDDAIYQIAALLAESASDDRKQARSMKLASERNIENQVALRVQNMRDAADDRRNAAVISGMTGMAAGMINVGGGVSGLATPAKAQVFGQTAQGMAAIFDGFGKIGSAVFEHDASVADARAVGHEASASRSERAADEHAADMDHARAFIDKVMDFLKEVRSGQDASARAAIIRG
ncbi:MAG: hypothetical protein IPI67_35140 [Myxococcales bacterium]|nr:hypothetical protein [Myxococcales bacterium]